MKIGIISDIHATMDPLHKAMALFDAHNVDTIVCPGDLVDRGNEGDAVVRFIRQRNIPCVQGNHDREAFTTQSVIHRLNRVAQQRGEPDMFPGTLQSETVSYLSELPATLHFDWEGHRVCLAHGTPASNLTYLFPWSERHEFDATAQQANADIVILGHTHVPMQVRVDDVWFLNAGSLHGNRTGDMFRTCGILSLPDVQLTVYNVDTGDTVPIGTITGNDMVS